MTVSTALVVWSTLFIPFLATGQTGAPAQTPPSGSPTNGPPNPPVPAPQSSAGFDRPISWKLLFPNILNDQTQIWSFPVTLAQGKNWIPTTFVLGTTAGLVALDPTEASYLHRTSTFQGFNNVFTGNATAAATAIVPASLYVIGLVRKDSKMQRTALLAGEGVVDAEILTTVLKDATKRVRPAGIPSQRNFSDSWFESSGSFLRGNGSFPSGHTIAAFSVATVVARRYGNHVGFRIRLTAWQP